MPHTHRILKLTAAAFTAIATPVVAQQPAIMHRTQQTLLQQPMEQHMSQMQEIMRRMSDMAKRSDQLQAETKKEMGQMHASDMSGHTALPQMSAHMNAMATQMKGMTEQMQTMMKDQRMMQDGGMRRGMDAMRKDMASMSKDMDSMLRTMEQMHKRRRASLQDPMMH